MRDQLQDPSTYRSVLAAFAGGANPNSEIAARSGVPATGLSTYLRPLVDLHLVERAVPFGADSAKSKKGLWTIADGSGAVGAWWGSVRIRADGKPQNAQLEADVVAGSRDEVTLVGEAKWSDQDVGLDALRQLRIATAAVPGTNSRTRLALFSRTGFEDRLRAVADLEDILLFDIEELFEPDDRSGAY